MSTTKSHPKYTTAWNWCRAATFWEPVIPITIRLRIINSIINCSIMVSNMWPNLMCRADQYTTQTKARMYLELYLLELVVIWPRWDNKSSSYEHKCRFKGKISKRLHMLPLFRRPKTHKAFPVIQLCFRIGKVHFQTWTKWLHTKEKEHNMNFKVRIMWKRKQRLNKNLETLIRENLSVLPSRCRNSFL